jgi:hypothetical protein
MLRAFCGGGVPARSPPAILVVAWRFFSADGALMMSADPFAADSPSDFWKNVASTLPLAIRRRNKKNSLPIQPVNLVITQLVPEPSAVVIVLLGIAGLLVVRRDKRKSFSESA